MTKKFKVKPRIPGKTIGHKLKMYGKTVTKQAFKDDCDINKIMARFIKTGIMDHVRDHGPQYGFASSDTFRESMEIVAKANSMFEELPSKIRNQFENDPGKFLDFVQDEKNLTEMQEMGLATKSIKETKQPFIAKTESELSELKPTNQEYQHGIDENTITKSVKTGDSGGKDAAS